MNKDTEALRLVQEYGSVSEASRETGIPNSTLHDRYHRALASHEEKNYSLPSELDDDIDTEELVDMLHKRFKKRKEHKESKKWMHIKMKNTEPIMLVWLGDPHIDDNYCDWDTLKQHIDIIQSDDNIYGCSLGDLSNNWIGRLSRLYANQDTSENTAWKLVEWLIEKIDPLILIGGNHDMWSGAGDPIRWMKKDHTIHEDWEARISLDFPNERSCKIHVAHDMPGHSQWNALHGQVKMSKFRSNAHLYISGHRHNWALACLEQVEQENVAWLARARGFKYYDDFAMVKGFEQQKFGQSICQVIDPNNQSPLSWNQCFVDPVEAQAYLNYRKSIR
jgi:hypothetical protein